MLLSLLLLFVFASCHNTRFCRAHQHDEHHHTSFRRVSNSGTNDVNEMHDCGTIGHDLTKQEKDAEGQSEQQIFGKRVG